MECGGCEKVKILHFIVCAILAARSSVEFKEWVGPKADNKNNKENAFCHLGT